MCGIAGLVGPGASDHAEQVRTMIDALEHRGPDDTGLAVFDGAVLGSARLSVVDPAGGHQPLPGPEGATSLVCNGEIYGHGRLRAQARGYPFRTGSDAEVILALYERHGTELLEHLPGTFAFALWDDRRRRLLLARDRFGERPLYVATTEDGMLAFASEPSALLASGLVRVRADVTTLSHMVRQGYVPSGSCIWDGIDCLPHASRLVLDSAGRAEVTRWWHAPEVDSQRSVDDAAAWFADELDRAVQDQLVADVPVGAFLSGGIDSTTIAALAGRHHGGLQAFAYDMPGESEVDLARRTAELHGLTLHVYRPDTADMAGQIREVAEIWDEPFADSSALPTHQLARFAREHVTTVLTGDGADELLGGYLTWARHLLEPQDAAPAAPVRRGGRWTPWRAGGRHAPAQGSPTARRYAGFRQTFSAAELGAMGLVPLQAGDVDVSHLLHDSVEDISRFDLDHYLPGDILVKTDRASMAHGLEVRAPYLDVRVAEGCLRLPAHHKVDEAREKLLLRRAFAHLWPDEVRDRPKQGFGAPMAQWLQLDDVKELIRAELEDPGAPVFDLLDHEGVAPHVARADQATWTLLMVALWWRRWRDQAPTR